MSDEKIRQQILKNAMDLAAEQGWNKMSLSDAARRCSLSLDVVRKIFPCKTSLLLYLNRLADQAALKQFYQQQPVPEYLFDLFMERFDTFQHYRQGFISAVHTLPFNPPLAFLLQITIQNSMKWLAEAAEINTSGLRGMACIKGLTAIWVLNMRVWLKDETDDLSQTMASLDKSFKKAEKFARYCVQRNTTITTNQNTSQVDISYFSVNEKETKDKF